MASPPPQPHTIAMGPDTLITVKVVIDGTNRRFKLALRDLGAHVLPQKLRLLLAIKPETDVKFERFSDSAGNYITLDSSNPSVYKQLYRAAKAKLKLRLRITIINKDLPTPAVPENLMDDQPTVTNGQAVVSSQPQTQAEPRQSYLATVLSQTESFVSPIAPASRPFGASPRVSTCFGLNNASSQSPAPQPKSNSKFDPSRPTVPSLQDFNNRGCLIDCNHCGNAIPNEHYHCSICDSGDFDLCQNCINAGVICEGQDHWLIKRFQQSGSIIPSFTETIAPKKVKNETVSETKEAKPKTSSLTYYEGNRTCNSCISELPEEECLWCEQCSDFDLCFSCFQYGEHGHHPAHSFRPVAEDADLPPEIRSLCEAGRGVAHDAICDGCDKKIFGVRHKCLKCPDWDFCATCVLSSDEIHPHHRFAPIYEPIPAARMSTEIHYGIYCDGPLCVAKRCKSYIRGDRYKCAVCHDTDFCSNCEAAPTHVHNTTHPLIKFKTPVRHVSVTTLGENNDGRTVNQMGDRPYSRHASTETTPPAPSTNAATQVPVSDKTKPADKISWQSAKRSSVEEKRNAKNDLDADFEFDSVHDGSRFEPNRLIFQSWTVRNTGSQAWPAGCAVYYIGGDDMRNLDSKHPSSVSTMTTATQSNVLQESLEPGKTAVFSVLLKSPEREGRAISNWRLKTPEGKSFGHKLWVDITVAATPAAELPEKSVIQSQATSADRTPTASIKAEDEVKEEVQSEKASTMIFPKLEKESPMSSVHDVAEAPQPTVEPTTKTEEQELLEDVESLELEDEETDDGFRTDEEYDILDASDEDYLLEAQNAMAAKK